MIKIFFAHPDPKISEIYRPHFERHFGFDSAHDGLLALRKIKRNKPSLIISSSDLPTISGIGLLKFVRSNPGFASIPFLIFSDYLPPQALELGANEWVDSRHISASDLFDKAYKHLRINYRLIGVI